VEVIRRGKSKSFEVKIGKLEDEQVEEEPPEERTDLGMTVDEITPEMERQFGLSETRGLVVVQVEPNSPAGEAGIRRGDIIMEVDQEPMKDIDEYSKKIRRYDKGDTILFLVKRREATLYLTLKVWE
jgi:serine protease Do